MKKKTMRNNFIRHGMPWIIAAVIITVLPLVLTAFHYGFEKITFEHPESTLPCTAVPSPDMTDSPDITPIMPPHYGNVVLILNTKSKKIHIQGCGYVKGIPDENKKTVTSDGEGMEDAVSELEKDGYSWCGVCLKKISK